jgi:hypothetical protein
MKLIRKIEGSRDYNYYITLRSDGVYISTVTEKTSHPSWHKNIVSGRSFRWVYRQRKRLGSY